MAAYHLQKRAMSAACSRMSRNALLFVLLAKFFGLATTFSPSLFPGSDRRLAGWARCRNVRGAQGMMVRLRATNGNETTSSRAGDDVEGVSDGKVGKGTEEKKFLFSRRLFNFFDKDKDGKVSVSEVASILGEELSTGEGEGEEEPPAITFSGTQFLDRVKKTRTMRSATEVAEASFEAFARQVGPFLVDTPASFIFADFWSKFAKKRMQRRREKILQQVEEAFVLPFGGSAPKDQGGEPDDGGGGWDVVLKGLGTATLGRMMNVTTTLARGGALPTKQANSTAGEEEHDEKKVPRAESSGVAGSEASERASRKRARMKQGKGGEAIVGQVSNVRYVQMPGGNVTLIGSVRSRISSAVRTYGHPSIQAAFEHIPQGLALASKGNIPAAFEAWRPFFKSVEEPVLNVWAIADIAGEGILAGVSDTFGFAAERSLGLDRKRFSEYSEQANVKGGLRITPSGIVVIAPTAIAMLIGGYVARRHVYFTVLYSAYLLSLNYFAFGSNKARRHLGVRDRHLVMGARPPWLGAYVKIGFALTFVQPVSLLLLCTAFGAPGAAGRCITPSVFLVACQFFVGSAIRTPSIHALIRLMASVGFTAYRLPVTWQWIRYALSSVPGRLGYLLALFGAAELFLWSFHLLLFMPCVSLPGYVDQGLLGLAPLPKGTAQDGTGKPGAGLPGGDSTTASR